jgi:subtilisin family serine protease
MKEIDERRSRPVKGDDEALGRCGPGIRQLLQMDDDEIIQAKEDDEKRIAAEPHPVFGPVVVDKRVPTPVKVRAIVNFNGNADDLRAMGIQVHSHAHDVFTITATSSQLADLASQPATRKIKLPRKFRYDLEDAVPQAEVDQIHTLGTEGDGVIVGVIDSGLNVRHHAFRDPTTHDTRVLFMWVQDPEAGAPGDSPEAHFDPMYPAGSNPFQGMDYGILYDAGAINTALGLADSFGTGLNQIAIDPTDHRGHGTHVAGIAAGNGLDAAWNPGDDVGAAPDADIVFVATDLDEDHIIDAANFIFEIANRRGQPAAINMSFGSHMGPHDGKSDYDRAQDAMLFSHTGRSIVRSAGNDNNDDGFRQSTVSAGTTEPAWTLDPNDAPVNVVLDIWYTGPELDHQLSCGVGSSTGWIGAGDTYNSDIAGQINNYDVYTFRDYETRTDMRNILVWIPAAGVDDWTIQLRNPGTTDVQYWAWVGEEADLDAPTFDELTLGDTACCKSVLTVGGCAKPVGANPEMIADYSGRGPTLDGRIKPEITAIGSDVGSASGATDATYVSKDGTSMAAPMVTGAIALLLENDPNLTQDSIKALLTQTADRTDLDIDPEAPGYDQFERNRYGFGRLRMLAPFEHSLPLVDVDVWVRTADDDYGFQPYPGECFCHAPEIKVLDSGGNETLSLTWGDEYTVQVRVHNLGDTPALRTTARIKYTRPWAAPDDWVPCQDPSHDPIEEEVDVPALGDYDLEFSQRWKPESTELPPGGAEWGDHYCLLVELNDPTHPDDPLHYDDGTSAGKDPWTKNIKGTNNVALRNLAIH